MAGFSEKTKEGKTEKPKEERISEEEIKKWFPERAPQAAEEKKEVLERKELTREEKEEREKLKEKIEKTELPSEKEIEALKEAARIKRQSVQGKVKHLLDLAQSKGVVYAAKVAKETKDFLVIDLFHDILAEDGRFKRFPK